MSGQQALAGKVAIVTGGSRGIGAAVCERYARAGARVIVNYVARADMAQAVVERIRAAGGQALAVHADVSKADQVAQMVEQTHNSFGPVDILVNNAAAYPRRPWHTIPETEWDWVMAVNLKGAFLCAKAVYPDMKAKGYGKIINVTSVTAELGHGPYLHYVTTKAGLIGLTRSLAREVGKEGIRVNCVMPGAILTEQELIDFPDQEDLLRVMNERQALPGRGYAKDMEGVFLFLASADSDFITGQVINVDGGWVMY